MSCVIRALGQVYNSTAVVLKLFSNNRLVGKYFSRPTAVALVSYGGFCCFCFGFLPTFCAGRGGEIIVPRAGLCFFFFFLLLNWLFCANRRWIACLVAYSCLYGRAVVSLLPT